MVEKKTKLSSIDCKDLLGQLHRHKHDQSKITAIDDSESLSDVDDEELGRYINSKEEIRYKKALWEEINREQTRIRGTKRAAEAKKAGPIKKATKVTIEAENQNRKVQSSKINYEALKKLEEELVLEDGNEESESSRSNRNLQANVTHSIGGEDCDDEYIQDDEYGQDATYGDTYNRYGGEEYGNDEFYDEY